MSQIRVSTQHHPVNDIQAGFDNRCQIHYALVQVLMDLLFLSLGIEVPLVVWHVPLPVRFPELRRDL